MKIYANLLGKWTELNDDYSINGVKIENFFETLTNHENFDIKLNNGFVKLENSKNNTSYEIHYTCLQKINGENSNQNWLY